MGKGMTPRKGYNAKKYREGFDTINWRKHESARTPLGGNLITREQAYKGLGDPKTWDNDEKQLMTEFNQKPICRAATDGECFWSECPQLKDGEPVKSGRHCPLDIRDDEI